MRIRLHHAAVHHLPLGQPEVSDLVEAVLQQDVRWLQVAVDYVELSQVPEALADLPEHVENPLLTVSVFLLVAVIE